MTRKMATMDGNTAAAHISYAFTDVAAIYPITPSSPMAEHIDEWATQGRKNIFGQTVRIIEMESEGGAAGAVHGSLSAGALTTTYTASQGLLLMIPNMFKIAGELLPGVFHVSSRALGANTLCIFGDHQDVMATRQTGFALLAENSVQQVMDIGPVAHLAAIKGRVPFLNFFDGFRTSHEVQKIELLEYSELANLVDWAAVDEFRRRGLNPDHPVIKGTLENSDVYFQQREVSNPFYQALPDIVEEYMTEITKLTGREYHLFNYYGAPDADSVIIAMGSVCEAIEETVDYLNAKGEKVGLLAVHLYRPFSTKYFFKYLPPTVKKIAVLDRTKELGAVAEPLYVDVKAVFNQRVHTPIIVGGRYGLGGKNVIPSHILAVYDNLKQEQPKDNFTVGIVDDVTYTSLPAGEDIDTTPPGTIACKFWGLGSDGTVGANKNAIKIIGDHTDRYVQAYFAYDSKKSGGVTISHLRFGKKPIKSPYLIHKADFIACHNPSFVDKYDLLDGLKDNGVFLLNCGWNQRMLDEKLPASMKRYIAAHNIQFYTLDAVKLAQEIGLGGRINMIMQAAFFKLANIIPMADAVKYLREAVEVSYGRKGQSVVDMNDLAIDQGVNAIVTVNIPAAWGEARDEAAATADVPEFITRILRPMNRQEGDKLPVSAFVGREDGAYPMGTSAFEKRGTAIDVPVWSADNCLQCNQCSFVCPHAAIRPALTNDQELHDAPRGFTSQPAIGAPGLYFRIAVSPLDCNGCGNCEQVCPAKEKALKMQPIATQMEQAALWDYAMSLTPKPNPFNKFTVKGSQFEPPLLEFSGSCAGCGETPYAKLATQLFGDRMMVANATGCSSVWAGSVPSMPYTTNRHGQGPAWANSLFEDNAEFGLGMLLGVKQIREKLSADISKAISLDSSDKLKDACKEWLKYKEQGENTRLRAGRVIAALEQENSHDPLLNEIYKNRDFLVKRAHWIFGGDGWAYDIGFGGLDHVLASGEDVNVLVFDTEVYSNTGGQSSKATPAAAIAKFAAGGKRTGKKDLGLMAMSYGYVYVAQIAMGADKNQAIKAMMEAEAYPGPSLIIAYAPCINHGIKAGMGVSQLEAKKAVEAGYWALYRFNPVLKEQGKNPFYLDSKEPTGDFRTFLMGEVRYAALTTEFSDTADDFFDKTAKDALEKIKHYQNLSRQ